MESVEVTTLSSRGQVVIPQTIRDQLRLHSGEKFIVMGRGDTIILKKMEAPSFDEFEALLKRTRQFARSKALAVADVDESITYSRKKKK